MPLLSTWLQFSVADPSADTVTPLRIKGLLTGPEIEALRASKLTWGAAYSLSRARGAAGLTHGSLVEAGSREG